MNVLFMHIYFYFVLFLNQICIFCDFYTVSYIYKKILIYLFGCAKSSLWDAGSLDVAHKNLGWVTWDLVPWPGIKPRSVQFSSVQSLNRVRLFATPWIAARQASLSITISRSSWSRWCHPAISSSIVPFSSCPQSLPASESFPMSQLFTWGGQSTGVSASASFPPMNVHFL